MVYRDDFLTPHEESQLLQQLAQVAVVPFRFQKWEGKRRTASFGWHYDFTDASFASAASIPDWLLPIRARAAAFAATASDELAQVLVTRYDPGAGIGWHRDRPVFGDIIGLSLGAPAVLRMRRRHLGGFERFALPLAPRSLYRLGGAARSEWEHSIVPMVQQRWSITFRTLRDLPRSRP